MQSEVRQAGEGSGIVTGEQWTKPSGDIAPIHVLSGLWPPTERKRQWRRHRGSDSGGTREGHSGRGEAEQGMQ